ncbi:MAG: ABC transporter ATP-binding protein [Oscillospiraceae bacterium]
MKKNEIAKSQSLKNIRYAWRLLIESAKARIAHMIMVNVFDYFQYIFFSTIFIRFVLGAIESHKSFHEILFFIIIVSVVFASVIIYTLYVENVSNPITNLKVYKNIYTRIYRKAEKVDLSCYENAEFYNKYTMAIDQSDTKIIESIENCVKTVIGFFALAVTAYIMFSIDSFVVLFIVFPIMGNFIFGNVMNKLYYSRYKDGVYYQRKSDYVNRVMYLSDFAKEIRLTNVFKILRRDYDDAVKGIEKVTDKYAKKATVFSFLQTYFTYTLIFEGVLLYGSYRALHSHSMPFSDLAVLTSIMTTVSWLLIGFTENLMKIFENGLFLRNLRGFLEYKEKITDKADGIKAPESINSIEFRDVRFGYEKDKPVLNSLSFKISGNSRVALVGINGAGKTTIIKLLFRLYDPDDGEILINGTNIKEYKLAEYRKLFSCAFQDFKIFADSVTNNIYMGRAADSSELSDVIKRSGFESDLLRFQNGADTVLSREFDNDGTVLSGGQQQKIAIARAFARSSPIKIFDEPSSALDPIAEYNIFRSILEESSGYTTLFISHRLSTVRAADCIFMLENGGVIETGSHTELIKLQGKYAEMYNYQARNYLADESYDEISHIAEGSVFY